MGELLDSKGGDTGPIKSREKKILNISAIMNEKYRASNVVIRGKHSDETG